MAAMAALDVRSRSEQFARPHGSCCKEAVPANARERVRTPASFCHAEGRGFESHHPLLQTKAPLGGGFVSESGAEGGLLQAVWQAFRASASAGSTGWRSRQRSRGRSSAASARTRRQREQTAVADLKRPRTPPLLRRWRGVRPAGGICACARALKECRRNAEGDG